MKILITIFLTLLTPILFAQEDVPKEYWIKDSNFEKKISEHHAFGDDDKLPVIVEFWASFNAANCFADWDKIEDAVYYRVDIAQAPLAKKKYKVRMAPTILVFKEGVVQESFKAGLDLLLTIVLDELQESINEINNAIKF